MGVYLRVWKERCNFAINALRNNKLRTFLSLLGVTIGIFSIIAVLAAVDSLDRNIKENLSGLDMNTMYISKYSFGPTDVPRWQRDNFPQTSYQEYEFIQRNVADVEEVAYVIFGARETVKSEGVTLTNIEVVPVTSEIYDIEEFKVEQGRFYTQAESYSGAAVVVLGYGVAEKLFENANAIGKQVRIYGRRLTVIGVLKKFGAQLFDSPDEKVYVPANFVRRFMNSGPQGVPGAIILKPKKDVDIAAFEEVLVQKLRNYRGMKYEDPTNFFVNKMSGLRDAVDNIIGMMNMVGWVIGGFSILVGGFGIANIMFVSVKERTSLIGIQKSLGAKNKFILFQFLFEAVILAFIGGLIGLFLVWVVSIIASSMTGDFKFVLSLGNMVLGSAVAVTIGLISGIVPAWSASRLDPVEAIRTGM